MTLALGALQQTGTHGPEGGALPAVLVGGRATAVADVPRTLAEGHLYRGKGGELMREAVCRCAANGPPHHAPPPSPPLRETLILLR